MRIKKISLVLLFVVLLTAIFPLKVSAQDEHPYGNDTVPVDVLCESQNTASAIVKLPVGKYDAYIRLGSSVPDEQAALALRSFTGNSSDCPVTGVVSASNKSYTLVKKSVSVEDEALEVFLHSVNTSSAQSAGGPQVVFVPSGSNICDFTAGCQVDYQGQKMELTPRKMSLSSETLKIGLIEDFKNLKVRTVIYSVDAKPAYELATLAKFDQRYVPGGEHTVTRRVVFTDGASLSDTESIKHGTVANATYIFQSIVLRQKKILIMPISD